MAGQLVGDGGLVCNALVTRENSTHDGREGYSIMSKRDQLRRRMKKRED
jgi:hypothetical protein